jgi:hypothetical protein
VDGLSALAEARAGGLTVRADGGRLEILGPKAAEPLALRLLTSRTEILAELAAAGPATSPGPSPALPPMPPARLFAADHATRMRWVRGEPEPEPCPHCREPIRPDGLCSPACLEAWLSPDAWEPADGWRCRCGSGERFERWPGTWACRTCTMQVSAPSAAGAAGAAR